MRRDRPPRRLAILGGGYIAAEFAHVFAPAGAEIIMIEQADRLLGRRTRRHRTVHRAAAPSATTCASAGRPRACRGEPGALRIIARRRSSHRRRRHPARRGRPDARTATGWTWTRRESTSTTTGRIVVDAHQRTTAEGVWALGDVCTPVPLKHVANREADVVAHNLRHPDDLHERRARPRPLARSSPTPRSRRSARPSKTCRDRGVDYRSGLARFGGTAYGWAMEDETGFCKVLADPADGAAAGRAHHGPAGRRPWSSRWCSRPRCGIAARTLATRPYWIHPALTEVVQQALVDAL